LCLLVCRCRCSVVVSVGWGIKDGWLIVLEERVVTWE
jgi:hypothetical protein